MGFAITTKSLNRKMAKKETEDKDKIDGMVGEAGYGITHGYSSLSETIRNQHEYKKGKRAKKK